MPQALRDAKTVFGFQRREDRPLVRPVPFAGRPGIDATLARAAREARQIPPEVEDAMRRDRENAERKHEKGETDEEAQTT